MSIQFENTSLLGSTIAGCFYCVSAWIPFKRNILSSATDWDWLCFCQRTWGCEDTGWGWSSVAGHLPGGCEACNPQHWKLKIDCVCWGFGLKPRLEACHMNKVSNHQNFSFTNLGFCFALFCLLLLFWGVLGYFVCFFFALFFCMLRIRRSVDHHTLLSELDLTES